MFNWLKSLFKAPQPAGPPQVVRAFRPADPTLAQDTIKVEPGGWLVEATAPQTVRLFEVPNPGLEQCLVTYRARLKTERLQGRAFLEMWCRLPGRGEFFSKGLHQAVAGTTDWASCEIPFYLKRGQKPDLIKLNLAVEGTGKVWIQDVELLQTPLQG